MTYKEFKDWCEDNGYDVTDNEEKVYVSEEPLRLCSVSKKYRNSMDTTSFGGLPEHLFHKVMELANTPLSERIDQEMYHVILPTSEDSFCALSKRNGITPMVGYHDGDLKLEEFRLTEEEIKAIDIRYMAFRERFE